MQRTIFSKILEGTISSYKVYEDETFYAFLDVYPRTKGHTLVIPKKQYRWVYDVPNFGEYWEVAKTISYAIERALKPVWINYVTMGLEVAHAHIHILPRFTRIQDMVEVYPEKILTFSNTEFEKIAKQIREAL